MLQGAFAGLNRRQLRNWLAVFFAALLVPTGLLVYQAYSQLKWESFYRYRLQSEELLTQIDNRLNQLVAREEARSFADYAFLVSGDSAANYLQRSTLADFPVTSAIPGLIGYFQVDSQGVFTTPLTPPTGGAGYGVTEDELLARNEVATKLLLILASNQLASPGKAASMEKDAFMSDLRRRASYDMDDNEVTSDQILIRETAAELAEELQESSAGGFTQAAFDRLGGVRADSSQAFKRNKLGRIDEIKFDEPYQDKTEIARPQATAAKKIAGADVKLRKQKEQLVAPITPASSVESKALPELRVSTFESEIDRFEFSMLDSGHFVLYRKAWRDGERLVQGLLIEQEPFVQGLFTKPFQESSLSALSTLIVAYEGDVLAVVFGEVQSAYRISTAQPSGSLLYRNEVVSPLNRIELLLSMNQLPVGPGATILGWLAALLLAVLCGGFYLLNRLGGAQIDLTRQQQDFVAAVSHELKTPLTSIRMYGEMLSEGWATEDNKKTYYTYIHQEAERLSRLIENVLQLARMTRSELTIELAPVTVAEVMDVLASKITNQVERAGFSLECTYPDDMGEVKVEIDLDHFVQIIINLVDNALKFSANATHRQLDLQCSRSSAGQVRFSVRDYGPGIADDQLKKIFTLFYRTANELTRETVGTGIGLALVQQLALQMNAKVDVVNKEPGVEFSITCKK